MFYVGCMGVFTVLGGFKLIYAATFGGKGVVCVLN